MDAVVQVNTDCEDVVTFQGMDYLSSSAPLTFEDGLFFCQRVGMWPATFKTEPELEILANLNGK